MELYLNIVYQMLYALYLVIKSSLSCIAKQIIPAKYRSKSVKGEIVLITGSGSGIGKLMAKQFARLGARLILVDIDQVSNEKTANEILIEGGNAKTFTCDLSNRLDIYKLADDVSQPFFVHILNLNNYLFVVDPGSKIDWKHKHFG